MPLRTIFDRYFDVLHWYDQYSRRGGGGRNLKRGGRRPFYAVRIRCYMRVVIEVIPAGLARDEF